MAQNRRFLTDTYKESFCCVCGISGVNQYYVICEDYIDYCGNIHLLKEILREILDFPEVNEIAMEACQDCKDKLVKFYHFKRKAQEVLQKKFKHFQPPIEQVPITSHNLPIQLHNDFNVDQHLNFHQNHEPLKIQSAVSLSKEVVIKEEKEETPDIVFADYSSDLSTLDYPPTTSQQNNKSKRHRGGNPVSQAAIKMRQYRERLKLPENRDRLMIHKQQQREYNRRHYFRKQGGVRSNSRRRNPVSYDEDYDDIFLVP